MVGARAVAGSAPRSVCIAAGLSVVGLGSSPVQALFDPIRGRQQVGDAVATRARAFGESGPWRMIASAIR